MYFTIVISKNLYEMKKPSKNQDHQDVISVITRQKLNIKTHFKHFII